MNFQGFGALRSCLNHPMGCNWSRNRNGRGVVWRSPPGKDMADMKVYNTYVIRSVGGGIYFCMRSVENFRIGINAYSPQLSSGGTDKKLLTFH